ncbi:MAG: TPM domain-containing protein, partial [Arcanobacterium sp.]|nr:TPM domain-containing protein [Arcanobacterium sp.]
MINSRLQNDAFAPQRNAQSVFGKFGAVAGISAALFFAGNSLAFAESPEAVHAIVTDHANVIEDDTDIASEISQLSRGQLRIFVVKTLDGYDATEWAKLSFEATPALSENDALVVLATEDRQIGWYADSDSGITSSAIETALDTNVTQEFRDGNWESGLEIFLANLQNISGSTSSDNTETTTTDTGSSSSNSSGIGSGIFLLGGTALAVGGGVYAIRKRSKNKEELEKAKKLKALAERASSSLLAADDATRTAEAELEFARAEFGFEATQEYAKTLGEARNALEKAFMLRRTLDDPEPETPAEQWDMNAQIIGLVESAQASLKSQEEWFTTLRDLAQRSETLLAEYKARINESEARLPLARTQISQLQHSFSPQLLSALQTYPEQVQTLLNSAKELSIKAEELSAAGNKNGTVPYLKMIEETLGQSGKLL